MPTLNNPIPDEDINMEEHSKDVQEQEPIEPQPHYNLRSQVWNIEIKEDIEDLEPPMTLKEPDFDLKDFKDASLENALNTVKGKNKPERVTEWSNDAYRDFMKLIVENNISNKTDDKFIKIF